MESSRNNQLLARRRRFTVAAGVWPWQTVPTVPRAPHARRTSANKNCTAAPAERSALVVSSPWTQAASSTSQASLSGSCETGDPRPAGIGGESGHHDVYDDGYSELVPSRGIPDDWPFETNSREKRRMWLQRRKLGNFYFRTEFRGLVYQVMKSRGWKPACPPRVSDAELTMTGRDKLGPTEEKTAEAGLEQPQEELEGIREDTCIHTLNSNEYGSEESNSRPDIIGAENAAELTGGPDRKDGEMASEKQWDVHWSYTKWAVETMRFARKLAPWQKVNHFRNSKELCRKDLMLKNLKKRRATLLSQGDLTEAHGYNFFPVSFELPKDYALFVEEFRDTGGIWIMKPSGSAEGRGIFMFSKLMDVKAWARPYQSRNMRRNDPTNPGSFVVQRYVSNPFLVGGKKFDLRLYLLVTSFRPLTAYLYRDGFARFSSKRFSVDPEHLKNELMHLTNHAVQRRGAASGRKWNIKKFKMYVAMQHGQRAMDKLFWDIQALMVRTVRAVDRLVISDRQSFELFGYDVMVDENLRPWLLEVNASPSLGASSREDANLKKQMIGDLFDVVDVEGRFTLTAMLKPIFEESLSFLDLIDLIEEWT